MQAAESGGASQGPRISGRQRKAPDAFKDDDYDKGKKKKKKPVQLESANLSESSEPFLPPNNTDNAAKAKARQRPVRQTSKSRLEQISLMESEVISSDLDSDSYAPPKPAAKQAGKRGRKVQCF